VGHTKTLIKKGLNESGILECEVVVSNPETGDKHYDKAHVIESLRLTLELISKDSNNMEYQNIHLIRKNLEKILFGRSIENINNWTEYKRILKDIDKTVAISILEDIQD
jgi:hypothetical protein